MQRRDDILIDELEWLREFVPATRGAAASLPPMSGERILVVCHLDVKMIPYFEALVAAGAEVWACAANPATTRDAVAEHLNASGVRVLARFADPPELPAAELRNLADATPRPHVERCEVEGRTLYLLAGGAMFNLAAGPGDPYNTFDLVTALMLEATAFLATDGVEYPPGVHLLPKKIQDRAARRFLDET